MNIYYTRNCLSIKIIKDILLVSEMAWFSVYIYIYNKLPNNDIYARLKIRG